MAGKYRALLIGNASYPLDRENLPDLLGPANDPYLLRGALEDPSVGLFTPDEISNERELSKQGMLDRFHKFFGSAKPGDILLLYFSGHGLLDGSSTLYLCAHDTVEEQKQATAVSSGQLNEFILESAAAQTIVVLDCCHSGAFKGGRADIVTPLKGHNRYVLASCRGGQLANDASTAHRASIFTEQLVAGLRGAPTRPGAEYLTIEDLHQYVKKQLEVKQRPMPHFSQSGDGGLPIARRRPPAVAEQAQPIISVPQPAVPVATRAELTLSETLIDLGTVDEGEELPVEHIQVTARRADGSPARWSASTTANWIRIGQGGPDRLDLTLLPRRGDTRANVEVRNEDTDQIRTVRLRLRFDPPATAPPCPTPPVTTEASAISTSSMMERASSADDQGDLREAEIWYRKAAQGGDAVAMNRLAQLLHQRDETAAAEDLLNRAVAAGNSDAMVGLGMMAEDRGEVDVALHRFRQAAELGNTDGMVSLGMLMLERDGAAEAQWWFERAAAAGNTTAMNCLGAQAAQRDDLTSAASWFRKAADHDDPEGMTLLGLLYLDANETQPARHWLRRAADAGDPEAMHHLATIALEEERLDDAEQWFQRAADLGHLEALTGLGATAYRRDDPDRASSLLRRAASAGSTQAMLVLGDIALEERRLNEAWQWFQQAADAGDAEAMVQLAELAQTRGDGAEASRWLSQADQAGQDPTDRLAAELRQGMQSALFRQWHPDGDYM